MNVKNNSSFNEKTSSKKLLYSLYELLVEGCSLSLPIIINLDNKTFNSSCISDIVLSSKLQLNELESSNNELINKLEVSTLKKNIKNGFDTFYLNTNQNLYTKFYIVENTQNLITSSDNFLKKLYVFLNNSKIERKQPVIYINDFQITVKDLKSTLKLFKTHISNKLLNQENNILFITNNEINEDNTKPSLFKKIDILSNLLNLDSQNNCSKNLNPNNLNSSIFKTINIA